MKTKPKLQPNKTNTAVYRVRLKTAYKKATITELLINQEELQKELNRRHKKGQI